MALKILFEPVVILAVWTTNVLHFLLPCSHYLLESLRHDPVKQLELRNSCRDVVPCGSGVSSRTKCSPHLEVWKLVSG